MVGFILRALFLSATVVLLTVSQSAAVPGLPNSSTDEMLEPSNGTKTVEELIEESDLLLLSRRPIDARAKLLEALKIAPNDYRPHLRLGHYYLSEVGHFTLAYRYIKTAEKLFEKQHGSDKDDSLDPTYSYDHALLLHLLSEAQLNLDQYNAALETLDRFQELYWMDWYPGTRAWILMKLKRLDEAIRVAQAGLLRQADPHRTWNILGILLSVKGSRKLSLHAFAQSVAAEMKLMGSREVATPLNNAGEVYRELFQDAIAESSWVKATALPDGCEHILPSLNLAILSIDQLRLFRAERVLRDFENCFAQQSLRQDTEHRALLALARGRIALHSNRTEEALELLTTASQQQQWFGKIGTNENDVRFAATVSMAQALDARAAALGDIERTSLVEKIKDYATAAVYRLRAWWLNRTAREIALQELGDLEDLWIRNTDTMLEYPTLGTALAGFSSRSFRKRINRMIEKDDRPEAHTHYRLYLATNLLEHGEEKEAKKLLHQVIDELRPIDRLARGEALARLIRASKESAGFFPSPEEKSEINKLKEELFEVLPSHVRFHDFSLPVSVKLGADSGKGKAVLKKLKNMLLRRRFENIAPNQGQATKYVLELNSQQKEGILIVTLRLLDSKTQSQIAAEIKEVHSGQSVEQEIVNNFIAKAFSHRVDPPGEQLPPVPILDGLVL